MQDIKYIFIGKDFASKQRAETRKQDLLSKGYTIKTENSKRITLTKEIKR